MSKKNTKLIRKAIADIKKNFFFEIYPIPVKRIIKTPKINAGNIWPRLVIPHTTPVVTHHFIVVFFIRKKNATNKIKKNVSVKLLLYNHGE